MVDFLRDNNLLQGILPHQMSVPVCSRSGDIIEPLLRPQVCYISTKIMCVPVLLVKNFDSNSPSLIRPSNFFVRNICIE